MSYIWVSCQYNKKKDFTNLLVWLQETRDVSYVNLYFKKLGIWVQIVEGSSWQAKMGTIGTIATRTLIHDFCYSWFWIAAIASVYIRVYEMIDDQQEMLVHTRDEKLS